MSATIEINALSPGSSNRKYEVNSNIVTGDLSGAGDCSTGTPGKYRPLLPEQQPLCSVGGDDPSTCDQETMDKVDNNTDADSTPDQTTDAGINSEETVTMVTDEHNGVDGLGSDSEKQEIDKNLLKNGNSTEYDHPSNTSPCQDQDANNDVNLSLSPNQALIPSELDSGPGKLEPDPSPNDVEISVASEINSDKQEDNSSSPKDEMQDETAKLKPKKKVGIFHVVQFRLPKFGMKRGQITTKDRDSSTSSDAESSPEKRSGKKKKKDKHDKKRRVMEDGQKDEDGDVTMVNDNDENTVLVVVEEGSQTIDLEQNKPDLPEEDEEPVEDIKTKQGPDRDKDGNIPDGTVMQTPAESMNVEEPAKECTDHMEQNEKEIDHAGHSAAPESLENEADSDAVAMVTEDADDKMMDEYRTQAEFSNADTTGPTDNEPSSLPNSSFASAQDFYTLPQSSLSSSTNPDSSEMTVDQREDSSTTKPSESSTLAEVESLMTDTSTKSYQEAAEFSSQLEDNSSAAVKTDGPLDKPDVIPAVEKSGDSNSSFEKPVVKELELNQEPSILSSSNQSSFDTDSPGLVDTPEHSPKKRSKRRMPLLNVTLPSFGKKHHRSSKSPEQSSDSDRPSSPSKKFPWKKKSPKKAASPVTTVGSSSAEEPTKDADPMPEERKDQEEESVQMSPTITEAPEMMDLSVGIIADAAVAVDLPEGKKDVDEKSPSDEKEEETEVSCEDLAEADNKALGDDEPPEKEDGISGSDEEEKARAESSEIEDVGQEDALQDSREDQDMNAPQEKEEDSSSFQEALPEAESESQGEEQLQEELGQATEMSTEVSPVLLPDMQHPRQDEIASCEKQEQEEEEEMKDKEWSLPEDEQDVEDDETSDRIPGVKIGGRIQMSASLEVHASPTHHVSSPADFILTDNSTEAEDDIEVVVKIPESPPADSSVELNAEKILEGCNQLLADDSVGDVQFTPEMLSEFTKTIDAFEEHEGNEDGGEEDSRKEEVEMDTGDDDKDLDLEGHGSFEMYDEDMGTDDHPSSEAMGSVPVDVGCQMTWEDEGSENGENEEVSISGMDGKIEIATGLSIKLDVPEDADKKSLSSSSSSSSPDSSLSSPENKPQEMALEDAEADAELNIHVTGIALEHENIATEIEVPAVDPSASVIDVKARSPKTDDVEDTEVALPDSQPVEIITDTKLPETSNSPLEVSAVVFSPSTPQIQGSVMESCDPDKGNEVLIVMNEEGFPEPRDEGPSSSTQDIKRKSKSKGIFSGFNFRLPRFRGRRSGKLDVTSTSGHPNMSEGKISFNTDMKRGSDDDIKAGTSGISKSSSEMDVSRRRSDENEDEFALDNRAPSVPDISQREMALKRTKKKSFTLPNMHLRLPRFGGKKTPKSPTKDEIGVLSPEEVKMDTPAPEANVILTGRVEIDADVPPVSCSEAENTMNADIKTDLLSSDVDTAIPVDQLPTLNTTEGEIPDLQATCNVSSSPNKEDDISTEVLDAKPQIDGLYVAVPAFIEDDSGSDEGVQFNGEMTEPEVTGDAHTDKSEAFGINVNLPSLSNVQSDIVVEQQADVGAELSADIDVQIDVVNQSTPDDSKIELPDKLEVSLPSDNQTVAGIGHSSSVGIGAPDVDKIVDDPHSPNDVEADDGGSLDIEVLMADEVKFNLPEVNGVAVEAVDTDDGRSDNTFVDKLELVASGECDHGKVVDVDVSVGLALSAGSGDASLENQVDMTDSSEEIDAKVTIKNDAHVTSPDPKNSPTKHRFKLPALNFSLPKFGGLLSPTKKSKKDLTANTEVSGTGGVNLGADEQVCGSTSTKLEEHVEAITEPVLESEFETSYVTPEIDLNADLQMRLGSLERKDKDPSLGIEDDVKAKLDFEADGKQEDVSFNVDYNSDSKLNGQGDNDKASAFNELGLRLAEFSFGAEVSNSYPECDNDKEGWPHVPSEEGPGSSVDLHWEDEMCSRVQKTAPKFKLSDIKGGLSLGVAVSEDGSIEGESAERMQTDESDAPEGGLKAGESVELSLPERPDLTMNSTEQPLPEETTSPQLPEASLSVDATISQRKPSVSSHSSAKSASSHNSQTNASENTKKKSGIMASLGLPKLHLKLHSPRSKSPNRAAEPKHPDEDVEDTALTVAELETSTKKPGGKKSMKAKKKSKKPSKSSKGKHKKESGAKAESSNREGIPVVDGNADLSLNITESAEMDTNHHSIIDLDPQPSTSSGPATSTPIKPPLSLNNSAQTPLTPCSLNIEQAIAVHSTPASPISPQPPSHRPFAVVIAIDFGTTFSGYAYSFTRDPDDIQIMRKWEGGDPGVTNMKTPTTLLLSPTGEFHSFGFTARDFYHDMDHYEAQRWQYFDKFKLALHNDLNLNLGTELTAANGMKVAAIQVFEHALRFFREHAMEELCDQSNDGRFDPGDIRWVLTVPAIWKQPAKQFMREAAYRAGIASSSFPEQLLMALEPEAASICIRKLRMRELVPERLSQRRKWTADKPEKSNSQVSEKITHGTRYMVVDCGGGTVDITVHEVEEDAGTLKELHKATGGMHGSVSVDVEFEKLLMDIFTKEYIHEFKIKRPAGWVDLMIAFESRKRNVNPYKSNPLNVSLPFSFIDYYKKYTHETATVEDAIWNFKSRDVTWSAQGMLRFSPEGMQELFKPAVANIISLVEGLLNKPQLKGVSYLFLAGGFAQSPLLQNHMRKKFASRLRVIIPRDVGLTILKGAVMFGLDPTAVRVRRSRLTYGVGVLNKFDAKKHPKEKHVVKDKVDWCRDVFDTFVQADQSVALGDKVTRSYTPAKPSQKSIIINIYCTERDQVEFITDEGVQKCGTMHIDVSDSPNANLTKRRELQLTMQYGDTEIRVSALDVPTGRCVKSNIDFLSK